MKPFIYIHKPHSCYACDLGGICRFAYKPCNNGEEKTPESCDLKTIDGLIEKIKEKGYCKDEYGGTRSDVMTVGQCVKIIKEYCGMDGE